MSIIQAILLGLLQGLTEFLPMSSSGHLALFQNLFHWGKGIDDLFLFDILLHTGTLISIFVVFFKDIMKLIVEFIGIVHDFFLNIPRWLRKEPARRVIRTSYRRFVIMIIISSIPTSIIGIILKDLAEDAAATLIMPGICFIITSMLLLLADRMPEGYRTPRDAHYLHSVIVGVAQGMAVLPGLSRSGATLTTSLMCGFDSRFAVKYSFIMSIPAVLGATILEIKDAAGSSFHISYIIGMLVAAVTGFVAIKFMLVLVRNRKYIFFSVYCMIAGIVAIVGHFFAK